MEEKQPSSPEQENRYETMSPDLSTELYNRNDQLSPRSDRACTIDFEDDRLHEMTASYSEISFDSQPSPGDASISDDHSQSFGAVPCLEGDSPSHRKSDKKKFDGEKYCHYEEFVPEGESKRPDRLDLEAQGRENARFHKTLGDLSLEGTVIQEGNMVSFVADDLEAKIKLASPVAKRDFTSFPGSRSSTPNLYRQALMFQLPALDPTVLNDLEAEARRIASSVDTLTENLSEILHSVSALTVDCLEAYRDAVCKTCDAVDSNIKSMYQLMAKCEELSKSMAPIYKLAEQIKDIKRLLDLFENAISS